MTVHFDCTRCGKCCHDLKLPLSIDEARIWLEHGGDLQVLCEAIPWIDDSAADDPVALRNRSRSFTANCGELPVRIIAILVAAFEGACLHLQPDMRCGFYEKRPRVCRIYPAEISPYVPLMPEGKACPTEAWGSSNPVLINNDRVVDPLTVALIEESRAVDVRETSLRELLCVALGIDHAALTNEGYVVHSPARGHVLEVLDALVGMAPFDCMPSWKLVSNQAATIAALETLGAVGSANGQPTPFEYLGFLAATPNGMESK